MRKIKKIHNSRYSPIRDLITYSPLPSPSLPQIDPFIFLNHHGHQTYQPNNNGLPFGPHPHRGMETVTFIIEGDVSHKDSGGHESVIKAGGVQWMTAGRGLIHAEVSSENFKKLGGDLEILQLWINLPAKFKMIDPFYNGLQKNDIPVFIMDEGKVKLQLVSGNWWANDGAFQSISDVHLTTIYFDEGGKMDIDIPIDENIFFYVVRGNVSVNGTKTEARQLVEFENNAEGLVIEALQKSIILLGYAKPFNEPVVTEGPFVMNTREEIQQAFEDYRLGKFGSWNG